MQQPLGSMSCFSTAVLAVLQWYGRSANLVEVRKWCGEDRFGCTLDQIEVRMESYGVDVDVWTRDFESKLRDTINDSIEPSPVIVTIQSDRFNSGTTDHAIVIVGIETANRNDAGEKRIYFMDPLSGQIENDEYNSFVRKWEAAGQRAFLINP